MRPSNESKKQAPIWDDEERRDALLSIFEREDPCRAREDLADLLILLAEELPGSTDPGVQRVAAELDKLIDLLFQRSETYQIALDFYRRCYHLKGATDPAQVLREAFEQWHVSPDKAEAPVDGEPDP